MKYFAMIGGQQYGPMELGEMVKEGVRPDTYVWCKGMDDWMPASDVPDICRYFRQRLSGTLPSSNPFGAIDTDRMIAIDEEEQERLLNQLPPMARGFIRKSGIKLTKENLPNTDPPQHFSKSLPIILYLISIIMIVIGFLLLK